MKLERDYLLSFLHLPYKWGGKGPDGYDCSGLCVEVLKAVGVFDKGDASAQGLYTYYRVNGSREVYTASFGCLIFYGKDTAHITHIGIALDREQMIESGGGGRKVTNIEEASKRGAMVRLRPISRRQDLVAIINPFEKSNVHQI